MVSTWTTAAGRGNAKVFAWKCQDPHPRMHWGHQDTTQKKVKKAKKFPEIEVQAKIVNDLEEVKKNNPQTEAWKFMSEFFCLQNENNKCEKIREINTWMTAAAMTKFLHENVKILVRTVVWNESNAEDHLLLTTTKNPSRWLAVLFQNVTVILPEEKNCSDFLEIRADANLGQIKQGLRPFGPQTINELPWYPNNNDRICEVWKF
jgi:hypothetical protein